MTSFSDAAWRNMTAPMWVARMEARLLMQEQTRTDLVITSGRRPRTKGGSSKHSTGEAMDIRTRGVFGSPSQIWAFADELARRLGEDFDVVVEGPAARNPKYKDRVEHVHVEYDPKGRHLTNRAD